MKKSKLVLNAIVIVVNFIGMLVLGFVGIEGGSPVATILGIVVGGIAIADAYFYWDRLGCSINK